MPSGRYSLYDTHDRTLLGEEHFHCTTGPSGWRYTARTTAPGGAVSGSVDLAIDTLGRVVRLELHAGPWQVRGAPLDGLTWVRSDATGALAREGRAAAQAFTGTSPAFLVATARLVARQAGTAGATRVRLVAMTPPVLAPRTVDQSWLLLGSTAHPTDSGPLVVDEYQVTALDTGETGSVHLAGDVVVAAPGVELEELDGPPSVFD